MSTLLPRQQPLKPTRWAAGAARLQRMDRLCGLALVAADAALLDASHIFSAKGETGSSERTAIVFGTAYGCHATNEDYYRGVLASGWAAASPRLFAYTLPSSPVGEMTIHYRILGPAITLAGRLTAGLEALACGRRLLRTGRADRVLVVAAEVSSPLLTRLIGRPVEDGAAAVMLERAEDANERGVQPRARLLAMAAGYAAHDRPRAIADATRLILAEAAVDAPTVRSVLGAAEDVAAVRTFGIDAAAHYPTAAAATLGVAPLFAAAEACSRGDGVTLVTAGDAGGAAVTALLRTGARP